MKPFYAILLCALISKSSSQRPTSNNDDALLNNKQPTSLRRRLRELEEVNSFDYSAAPLPTAASKCALINVLVNETSTTPAEQAWLKNTDIPDRITRYSMQGYDHVFVCGSACGKPVSDPSTLLYRSMGCTKVSTGSLANPDVMDWHNRTADATVTNALNDRIYDALEHTMDNLPSSIEGIDLLATCQLFDRNLVFLTTEYEERLNVVLTDDKARLKTEIQNNGYTFNAISHWSAASFVGTYVY